MIETKGGTITTSDCILCLCCVEMGANQSANPKTGCTTRKRKI